MPTTTSAPARCSTLTSCTSGLFRHIVHAHRVRSSLWVRCVRLNACSRTESGQATCFDVLAAVTRPAGLVLVLRTGAACGKMPELRCSCPPWDQRADRSAHTAHLASDPGRTRDSSCFTIRWRSAPSNLTSLQGSGNFFTVRSAAIRPSRPCPTSRPTLPRLYWAGWSSICVDDPELPVEARGAAPGSSCQARFWAGGLDPERFPHREAGAPECGRVSPRAEGLDPVLPRAAPGPAQPCSGRSRGSCRGT